MSASAMRAATSERAHATTSIPAEPEAAFRASQRRFVHANPWWNSRPQKSTTSGRSTIAPRRERSPIDARGAGGERVRGAPSRDVRREGKSDEQEQGWTTTR